jgi:hypothetical protein
MSEWCPQLDCKYNDLGYCDQDCTDGSKYKEVEG